MATFRGLYPNRRGDGDIHIYNQKILHVHLLYDAWVTCSILFHYCLLDQLEALYP